MRKHLLRMAILVMMPLTVFAQSQEELREGDVVTTDDHYTATVKQVFPNETVEVVINSEVYILKLNQLSKPISCLGSICVGDVVTTDDHYTATVKQVFPDNWARVEINGKIYSLYPSQLSKPISCLGSICVGDIVTTDDHDTATVKQVFPDNLVRVEINGKIYSYQGRELTLSRKM